MKATIRKIYTKTITPNNGKDPFKKLVFECEVITDSKGTVKTMKAEMSPEYAVEYFNKYLGYNSAQLIGKECHAVVQKRTFEAENEVRYVYEIKYLNMIDEQGNPIIMNKTANLAVSDDVPF